MELQIIFEDEYSICINKPNNMLVHHAYHSRNVSEELSVLQQITSQRGYKTYPIHRLDRKTSGILLLAKKKEFVSKFQDLFTNKAIEKVYFGIVRGFTPDTKIIDSPVKGRDAKVHKEALTYLENIAKITLEIPVKPYDTSRYSMVKLLPKTGRMHQLRVHANKISHPLVGDPKYGDKNHNIMFEEQFQCKNLFLHAGKLIFQHPFSLKQMNLAAAFPNDWQRIFKAFDWKTPLL